MVWRMGFRRVVLLLTALAGSVYAAVLLYRVIAPTEQPQSVSFPVKLSRDLRILTLTGYDGPYLEDGSMEEVTDSAALVLENTGLRTIGSVTICLCTSGGDMVFKATCIPPKSRILVLETSRKTYTCEITTQFRLEELTYCRDLLQSSLRVWEFGERITVYNLTGQEITNAVLCFKQYDEATGMFIGGVSRQYALSAIPPQGVLSVSPTGFLLPYCRVAIIKAGSP